MLFFAIPDQFHILKFENGILLYVILATSILMTWSLIRNKNNLDTEDEEDTFNPSPNFEDEAIKTLVEDELGITHQEKSSD